MKYQFIALSLILLTICSCTKEEMMDHSGTLGIFDVYNGDYNVSSNSTTFSPATLKLHSNVQIPTEGQIDIFLYDEHGFELEWLGTLYDDGDKLNNDHHAGDGKYHGSVCYSRYRQVGTFYMMATAAHDANLISNKISIRYVE